MERKGATPEKWWWFGVSGDMQTYAPFKVETSDTRDSVQDRVVEYYNNRLFRLTQPSQRGSHWGQRRAVTAPAPAAASTEAVSDTVA
jgi:hypothetical protein